MSSHKKPTPIEAFELNMGDADRLVLLADALTNVRTYRMRKELRARVGDALKLSGKAIDALDCVESDDLFVVLKPGTRLTRQHFDQHAPLLRQAIVAGCAATETYVADKVTAEVRNLVAAGRTTPRMAAVGMSYADWVEVESYTRRKRGITEQVLGPYVREHASTASNRVGELLALVDVKSWAAQVDARRGVVKGRTVRDLDRITERRNRIAHEGDRAGYGRGSITVKKVHTDLLVLRSVVEAIESLL